MRCGIDTLYGGFAEKPFIEMKIYFFIYVEILKNYISVFHYNGRFKIICITGPTRSFLPFMLLLLFVVPLETFISDFIQIGDAGTTTSEGKPL